MSTALALWTPVCRPEHIAEGMGVAALHQGQQVAIFKVAGRLYAIGNVDPYSGAGVLSRGIIGDKGGVLKVASPLYKQNFALEDGRCLDDPSVRVPSYAIRVEGGLIEIGAERQLAAVAA